MNEEQTLISLKEINQKEINKLENIQCKLYELFLLTGEQKYYNDYSETEETIKMLSLDENDYEEMMIEIAENDKEYEVEE